MSDSEKPKSSWRERRQSIKHKWLVPFIFPEWLCERLSYLLGRWAFLDILGHAGRLTILIAVIFYVGECDERRMQSENQRKAKHYQAWQVINAAQGKPGSGGRIDALQDLTRDEVSLDYVDLSGANLTNINIESAKLSFADLSGASLLGANLARADLSMARLSRAILGGANLTEANLLGANLSRARLPGANLSKANLWGVDLSMARLYKANLSEANHSGEDLSKKNLKNIENWQKIQSILYANIY